MRAAGVLLILLGAVGLCVGGFRYLTREAPDANRPQALVEREHSVNVPPALAGIAITVGSLLLVYRSRPGG